MRWKTQCNALYEMEKDIYLGGKENSYTDINFPQIIQTVIRSQQKYYDCEK